MKFPTQHRFFSVATGKTNEKYQAHRKSNVVWATLGVKNTTVFQKAMQTVSQAKTWMQHPGIH